MSVCLYCCNCCHGNAVTGFSRKTQRDLFKSVSQIRGRCHENVGNCVHSIHCPSSTIMHITVHAYNKAYTIKITKNQWVIWANAFNMNAPLLILDQLG
jgi:hypothetical protein